MRTGGESSTYGGHGLALLRHLARAGRPIFAMSDARRAARAVGIAPTYLGPLLHRLAGARMLLRIKRGHYAFAEGLPSTVPPHPFALAMALADGAVISGWTALNYHQLTEQIPQAVTLSTSKRIVTPAMRGASATPPSVWQVGEQRFELVTTLRRNLFGVERIRVDDTPVRIFDRERALLDCFAQPRRFGGLAEGLAILEEHLDQIDQARLSAHARRYSKVAVAKRVGWALEQVGAPAGVLEPLEDLPMFGYRHLDPTRVPAGPRVRRWQLIVNLDAAPDRP